MALKERYDLENLVNEAERLVFEQLEILIDDPDHADVCKCHDCILDIAALALNKIEPMYRVSLMGTLYAHSLTDESEYVQQIKAAVNDAFLKISKNPSH